MNSTDFVISKIDYLVSRFPQLKLEYEFDEWDKDHFIQIDFGIMPIFSEIFENEITEIILDFIHEFPNESIGFLRPGSLVEVEKPIYIKSGYMYIHSLPWADVYTGVLGIRSNYTPLIVRSMWWPIDLDLMPISFNMPPIEFSKGNVELKNANLTISDVINQLGSDFTKIECTEFSYTITSDEPFNIAA